MPNDVTLRLAHPLTDDDVKHLRLDPAGTYGPGQPVRIPQGAAKSLIAAGYATVDPEDRRAVRMALTESAVIEIDEPVEDLAADPDEVEADEVEVDSGETAAETEPEGDTAGKTADAPVAEPAAEPVTESVTEPAVASTPARPSAPRPARATPRPRGTRNRKA